MAGTERQGRGSRLLQDSFGRRFPYLRLSVTDACNFRCSYCLPQGYPGSAKADPILTLAEIRNLVTAFAELGTWKVRITGGEPTLRRDLPEMIAMIRGITGIRKIGLSTNGHRLKFQARELLRAGVSQLNVSIDSLDAGRFARITGSDRLPEILEGIQVALDAGSASVKVNAVLLGSEGLEELPRFLSWIRDQPITVRFIELMPTALNQVTFRRDHLKADLLRSRLESAGWRARARGEDDGPAIEFLHPDYRGRVGLIAPYSTDFCGSCNRLRVTSRGALQLCLFAEGTHSLRPLLQRSSQKEELKARVAALLDRKEVSHYLPEGRYGNNQTFSAIGG